MGMDAVASVHGEVAARTYDRGRWIYYCRHILGDVAAAVGSVVVVVVVILLSMFRDLHILADAVVVLEWGGWIFCA